MLEKQNIYKITIIAMVKKLKNIIVLLGLDLLTL